MTAVETSSPPSRRWSKDPRELKTLLREAVDCERKFAKGSAVSLSGGLDSSSVCRSSSGWLWAYSGNYDEPRFSELEWAKIATVDVEEVRIFPRDLLRFEEFASCMQRPYQGVGAFGQWLVAERIAKHGCRHVLSGEGADELFGGYARLYPLVGRDLPPGYEGYQAPEGYPKNLAAALEWEIEHLQELLACDRQILAAHGLTGGAPFTDPEIVRWALELMPTERVGKGILRDAMRGVVPDAILDRTDKMGFPAPWVVWIRRYPLLAEFVQERIGYLPRADRPFAREWFHDLIDACTSRS